MIEPIVFRAPYHNDFSAEKGYLAVLFKPELPVQSRELNQLQSILQHQIALSADIFDGGSNSAFILPSGGVRVQRNIFAVRIEDNVSSDTLATLVGRTIYNVSTGAEGEIVGVDTRVSFVSDEYPILFIRQTKSSPYSVSGDFASGVTADTLSVTSLSLDLTIANGSSPNPAVSRVSGVSSRGLIFRVGDFLVPAPDAFIPFYANTDGSVRVYSTVVPEARVGLFLASDIVVSQEDPSLLDPAVGSSNFGGIGADRLKISAYLSVKTLDGSSTWVNSDDTDSGSFLEIMRISEDVTLIPPEMADPINLLETESYSPPYCVDIKSVPTKRRLPSVQSYPKVFFKDESGIVIGSGRLSQAPHAKGLVVNGIEMNPGVSLDSAAYLANAAFYGGVFPNCEDPHFCVGRDDPNLIEFPRDLGSFVSMEYNYHWGFSVVTSSSGEVTLTAPAGHGGDTFYPHVPNASLAQGDGLRFNLTVIDEVNDIDITSSVSSAYLNSSATTLTITGLPANRALHVIANLKSNTNFRSKTLVSNFTIPNNLKVSTATGNISLGVADVVNIVSVTDVATSQDVTSKFTFFNGQFSDRYDYATLTPVDGFEADGEYSVTINYLQHSGSGPILPNAYSSPALAAYGLQEVASTNGNIYRLNRAIDFRPIRRLLYGGSVPPDYVVSNPYDFFTPPIAVDGVVCVIVGARSSARIDTVAKDSSGKVRLFKGIHSIAPEAPHIPVGFTPLYNIHIPAHTGDGVLVRGDNPNEDELGEVKSRLNAIERLLDSVSRLVSAFSHETLDISGNTLSKASIFFDGFGTLGKSVASQTTAAVDPLHGVLHADVSLVGASFVGGNGYAMPNTVGSPQAWINQPVGASRVAPVSTGIHDRGVLLLTPCVNLAASAHRTYNGWAHEQFGRKEASFRPDSTTNLLGVALGNKRTFGNLFVDRNRHEVFIAPQKITFVAHALVANASFLVEATNGVTSISSPVTITSDSSGSASGEIDIPTDTFTIDDELRIVLRHAVSGDIAAEAIFGDSFRREETPSPLVSVPVGVAQEFAVTHHGGHVLHGGTLRFASKSTSHPVIVAICKYLNGGVVEKRGDAIAESIVIIPPNKISTGGGETNFDFSLPVVLPAGRYFLTVGSASGENSVFYANQGDVESGVVASQTADIGSLYCSGLSSWGEWEKLPLGACLTFSLRRFIFEVGSFTTTFTHTPVPLGEYDAVFLPARSMVPSANGFIRYQISTTPVGSSTQIYSEVNPYETVSFVNTREVSTPLSLTTIVETSTSDPLSAPVFYPNASTLLLIKNKIGNTAYQEDIKDTPSDGAFRYISKPIRILSSQKVDDIAVYLKSIIPPEDATLEVYVKAFSEDVSNPKWVLMNRVETFQRDSEGFLAFEYRSSVKDSSGDYTVLLNPTKSCSSFQVKIVGVSSNSAKVPIVRSLEAVAIGPSVSSSHTLGFVESPQILGENIGSGEGKIYAGRNGDLLSFKSLKSGAGIQITQTAADVTISSVLSGSVGSGVSWVAISASQTVGASENGKWLLVDTTGAQVDLDLDALYSETGVPYVVIADAGNASVNNIVLNATQPIRGVPAPYIIDIDYAAVIVVKNSSSSSWAVYPIS
jgi:hypothetical protein